MKRPSAWLLAPLLLSLSIWHLSRWGTVPLAVTVDLVKLEWTSWAVVGMAYSAWFLWDVLWGDARAVLRSGQNGHRASTVELYGWIGLFMLGVHMLLFAIGVNSMSHPLPLHTPPGDARVETGLVVSGESLVLMLTRINQLRRRLQSM
jgi:hypothetical protein